MNASNIGVGVLGVAYFLIRGSAVAGDIVCFEAESAQSVSPPMEIVDATNQVGQVTNKAARAVSGGKYVEIAQGKGNPPKVLGGQARYVIQIGEEGSYYLWCRAWWEDDCGNSFTMSVDGEPPFIFGEDSTFKCWHWVKAPPGLKQLKLSKGAHTLLVSNREDGVKLDQILFTRDRRYVPVDVENVTFVPPPPQQAEPAGEK